MTGSLTDALLAVHRVLDEDSIRHALCGGLAANLYRKEVRATSDVDLAVAVSPSRLIDVTRRFVDAGWDVEPYWSHGEQLRLNHENLPRVDCIIATTDYERSAIERAVPAEIEGNELKVLTIEDLIVFKLIAGRARDYEAVAAMISERGEELDVFYITGWLDQFGASDAWTRAIEEARREAE
jgi:predicted nucleotidyltransferase